MKPFTIRKAAQTRAGASGLGVGDASVDAGLNKYNTGGPDRGNSVNYGPLSTAKDDTPMTAEQEDETLLDQADLDKLAEDFPGKTPENPWIKEQTNKQFLTQIKVSAAIFAPSPNLRVPEPLTRLRRLLTFPVMRLASCRHGSKGVPANFNLSDFEKYYNQTSGA